MQVLIQKSNVSPDCECAICGQGFRLIVESSQGDEGGRMSTQIRDAIHAQHLHTPARNAHPEVPFTVPKWPGLPQFSEPTLHHARAQRSGIVDRPVFTVGVS